MRRTTTKHEEAAAAHDVATLADEHRALVEKTLLEGGTLEDAAETVAAAGGPAIEPQAVARFFNSRPDLQAGRVRRMIEAVDAIKSGAADPNSVEARMVDAAIMEGLQRVDRKTARLTARQAVSARQQKETILLRQELLKAQKELVNMRVGREQKEELLIARRTEHEIARTQMLRAQTAQLLKIMEEDKQDLKPQLIDKIHEIYGLANLPEVPAPTPQERT